MKTPLDGLLSRYSLETFDQYWQALREIAQELTLLSLWRGKFFEHAAFYGGTALRIVHGLQRFSEDLDFSLLSPNPTFKPDDYFPYLQDELRAFGFEVSVEQKPNALDSQIQSASVKLNTRINLLQLGAPQAIIERLSREQVLKIKFEVDIDPPSGFNTEVKFFYLPQAFSVRLFDIPSMFAGKLHAIIARSWKKRVKGRDLYDLVWFVGHNHPALLEHLRARLLQTGHIEATDAFNLKNAQELLRTRFQDIDFKAAKEDVRPFLRNISEIDIWCMDFFVDMVSRIRFS